MGQDRRRRQEGRAAEFLCRALRQRKVAQRVSQGVSRDQDCGDQWRRELIGHTHVSEARAGQVLADLHSGGAVTNFEILYKGKALDSLKSALLLPEVLDESKWYGGKHRYNDQEQQYVFIYIANPTSTSIYFNLILSWLIRKNSNPSGISSILSGRVSLSPKSRLAPVSARRYSFSFTSPTWGRSFCGDYLSISNPSIPAIGAR